jgi:hypothetical protein
MKEVIGAVQKWSKTQQKKIFFPDGIKKNLVKRWNRRVEVEGITLKSTINFVSVYLQ